MAEGNQELKKQAIQSLEQGRRELSIETAELKHSMNPKVVARRAIKNHPMALIVTGVVAGLIVAGLIWRKRHQSVIAIKAPKFKIKQASEPKAGALGLVTGLLLKTALPYVGRQMWHKFTDPEKTTPAPSPSSGHKVKTTLEEHIR